MGDEIEPLVNAEARTSPEVYPSELDELFLAPSENVSPGNL